MLVLPNGEVIGISGFTGDPYVAQLPRTSKPPIFGEIPQFLPTDYGLRGPTLDPLITPPGSYTIPQGFPDSGGWVPPDTNPIFTPKMPVSGGSGTTSTGGNLPTGSTPGGLGVPDVSLHTWEPQSATPTTPSENASLLTALASLFPSVNANDPYASGAGFRPTGGGEVLQPQGGTNKSK